MFINYVFDVWFDRSTNLVGKIYDDSSSYPEPIVLEVFRALTFLSLNCTPKVRDIREIKVLLVFSLKLEYTSLSLRNQRKMVRHLHIVICRRTPQLYPIFLHNRSRDHF
jgi:hypothetical protein